MSISLESVTNTMVEYAHFAAGKITEWSGRTVTVLSTYNTKVHAFHVATGLAVAVLAGLLFHLMSFSMALFALAGALTGRHVIEKSLVRSQPKAQACFNTLARMGAQATRDLAATWSPNRTQIYGFTVTKNLFPTE